MSAVFTLRGTTNAAQSTDDAEWSPTSANLFRAPESAASDVVLLAADVPLLLPDALGTTETNHHLANLSWTTHFCDLPSIPCAASRASHQAHHARVRKLSERVCRQVALLQVSAILLLRRKVFPHGLEGQAQGCAMLPFRRFAMRSAESNLA